MVFTTIEIMVRAGVNTRQMDMVRKIGQAVAGGEIVSLQSFKGSVTQRLADIDDLRLSGYVAFDRKSFDYLTFSLTNKGTILLNNLQNSK